MHEEYLHCNTVGKVPQAVITLGTKDKSIILSGYRGSFNTINCEHSELSNPGSILMMCVRMYVCVRHA